MLETECQEGWRTSEKSLQLGEMEVLRADDVFTPQGYCMSRTHIRGGQSTGQGRWQAGQVAQLKC
jgi:hypothetical protein